MSPHDIRTYFHLYITVALQAHCLSVSLQAHIFPHLLPPPLASLGQDGG